MLEKFGGELLWPSVGPVFPRQECVSKPKRGLFNPSLLTYGISHCFLSVFTDVIHDEWPYV